MEISTEIPRYLHTPQGVWVQRVYGRGIYALTRSTDDCWLVSVATARLTGEGWEPAYKRHYSTPKTEAKSQEFLLASVRAYMAEIGALLTNCQQPDDHPFPPEL